MSEPLEVVLLTETVQRDVKGWLEDLMTERQRLEERLRIVDQRHTILTNQKTIMEFSSKARYVYALELTQNNFFLTGFLLVFCIKPRRDFGSL